MQRLQEMHSVLARAKQYEMGLVEGRRAVPKASAAGTRKSRTPFTALVVREFLKLCATIEKYGFRRSDGHVKITFGSLFNIYEVLLEEVCLSFYL